MERMVRIEFDGDLYDVNKFLELGWKVKMISSTKSICYVVLEMEGEYVE